MSNEREKERAQQDRSFDLRASSADLLDLVRTAEEDARLALRKRTPAVPIAVSPSGASAEEEFVDVGDDALDAPPSKPPVMRNDRSELSERREHVGRATPTGAFPTRPTPRAATDAGATIKRRASEELVRPGLPPALAIALVFALAVGALAILIR